MKLVSPTEYITQASQLARLAKDRIYVMSMVFADHPETHELIVELEAAARRGVKVVILADLFTYGEVGSGFLPFRYYNRNSKDTKDMVKKLKRSGVKFRWLGHGRTTLYNGRTHNKWCIIDDEVFSLGGVNIYSEGIKHVDYMFRLNDEHIANRLVEEQLRIQKAETQAKNYPSTTYEHNGMKILIDGGIIGQSVIYRRAIELTETATDITFVSQYCPTGKLSRLFKKKSVKLYYNRPSQANGLNKILIKLGQLTTGLDTLYKRDTYLHAKFIIFTMKDGTKVAISGSHNFAYTGVLLGTREVALETTDPNIISQLEDFIKNEVAIEK